MRETPVKVKPRPICQGATYSLKLVRKYLPYSVTADECGHLTNQCTGEAVSDADYVDEDYAGCTARMQIRPDVGSSQVIFEASTENGSIALSGSWLTLLISAEQTTAMNFDKAIGHIEITRPDGTVERQYELTFSFSPEVTK